MWYTYIIKEEMPMAAKNRVTYHEENINANTLKLREVLDTMPRFSKDFFRAIEPNTSAKTRISYVYDIRLFFSFFNSVESLF